MVRPLHPRLLAHLAHVPTLAPGEPLDRIVHARTLRRWHRELGEQLIIFPSFALAALGLAHLHVFVENADPAFLQFPYAVEHAWVTENFRDRSLYLHCIVPTKHQHDVQNVLTELANGPVVVGHTRDARQTLTFLQQEPPAQGRAPRSQEDLLRSFPLVVPVIFEGWNRRRSMPGLWTDIRERLGQQVREYVPTRVHFANGKRHVKDAYETLTRAGLFQQQLIRYAPLATDGIEVIMLLTEPAVVRTLQPHTRSIEYYEGDPALLRLVGSTALLDALLSLPPGAGTVYLAQKQRATHVRFCYEDLFDPRRGTWRFSRQGILDRIRGAA